jgi:hypothetical protein
MSAGVLHGVPVMTFDVDLWIDLPSRQYMRPVNIALRQGATMLRNTVIELSDGMLVNFAYEVTGLGSFGKEFKKTRIMVFHGVDVPVMPLALIQRSKEAIRRPKDLVHLELIRETLRLERKKNAPNRRRKGAARR